MLEGIDFIQLREKDLPSATLAALARRLAGAIAETGGPTRLLINSRADVAISTGAYGVHLTSGPDELTPTQVRSLYASSGRFRPVVTVSAHTREEVQRARENQADAILFGPVFEKISGKIVFHGQGLDKLRAACAAAYPVPVYALGGVTLENAPTCVAAGAAGVAGIRLFHHS